MLDRYMKATRTLRLRPRALFSEDVMLDVDVDNKMASLTCEPSVSNRSNTVDYCTIDLVLSSLSILESFGPRLGR